MILRITLAVLLIAMLEVGMLPVAAYAADNNPASSTLDAFPAIIDSLDTMDENSGTIGTLYGGGTINVNRGEISYSCGNVLENYGHIDRLAAGHVGTNYGTINSLENSGSLGVNDGSGTILSVGMGNEVSRNDGTIQSNAGNIADNYGTVGENYGNVLMHDGQIVTNKGSVKIGSGTVTINNNAGNVEINGGTVTITNNTGNIAINNGNVTVVGNSGGITVSGSSTLDCSENKAGGVITKLAGNARVNCGTNNGTINDLPSPLYEIVFSGDDGKAVVIDCDKEENGVYYTKAGSGVIFTLPPEYECSAGSIIVPGDLNTWGVNTSIAEGSTEFTIICHICIPGKYAISPEKHWQVCSECGKKLTDTEGAHTFGEYVSDDNATCVKDGTETALCTVCKFWDSRRIEGSHLTSDHHEHVVVDQRVEPTETTTGLTEGSHCEACNKVLKAQEVIPAKHVHASASGYLHDDSAHWQICSECNEKFGEETHDYTDYVSNGDATCTEDGTKTAKCRVCDAENTIEDTDSRLGHSFTTKPSSEKAGDAAGAGAEAYYVQCDRCDAVDRTKTVLAGSGQNTNKPVRPTDTSTVRTGDNSRTALWVVLIAVSGAGLTGIAAYLKKKEH